MTDLRDKGISTKLGSPGIVVKDFKQLKQVAIAEFYPAIGEEISFFDPELKMYTYCTIKEYKTPLTMVIKANRGEYIFTLRTNGAWIPKGFPSHELNQKLTC